MFTVILHKWLKVPYVLNLHVFHNPRHPRATVLFIHGIGTSWRTWEEAAKKMPADVRVVAIDLLGFGDSPKPHWKVYNARTQVDSIVTTLLRYGILGPILVVGHSLGSLVAVELARRYPQTVRSLILCSPPFYRPSAKEKFYHPETFLRRFYRLLHDNPVPTSKLLQIADERHLWPDPGYQMDEAGTTTFLATLDAAIVNQTALRDAVALRTSTLVIYGKLDPLIVEKNIKYLDRHNSHVALTALPLAAHDMRGDYTKTVVRAIIATLDAY